MSIQNVTRNPSRLVNTAEVAEILGASPRKVSQMAKEQLMPQPFRLRGSVRWTHEVIEKWIDSNCVPPMQGGAI